MKFTTKLDIILEDESFMLRSQEVFDKIEKIREKKGKVTSKDAWRVVESQIKKKVRNPNKIKGVCTCDSNILCKHRKKYIRKAMNGG